jgi:hypothetical protein
MLFTYQKKTGKIITSQTTHLPAIQEKGYIQIDIDNNTLLRLLFKVVYPNPNRHYIVS